MAGASGGAVLPGGDRVQAAMVQRSQGRERPVGAAGWNGQTHSSREDTCPAERAHAWSVGTVPCDPQEGDAAVSGLLRSGFRFSWVCRWPAEIQVIQAVIRGVTSAARGH